MKKLIFSGILFFALAGNAQAQGERQVLANIGPAISSGAINASGFDVTISSGGSGVRNCLTEMTVVSDAAYTLTIYDGGSTAMPAIWEMDFSANAGITKDWPFFGALCGSKNTELSIEVSAGTTHKLTYVGYRY